jgi:hypothetical protein
MPEKAGRPRAAPLHQAPMRIEYLDHRSEEGWREYRLAVHTPAGPLEIRFRIADAAFASSRVLLQDGPSVCYQQLVLLATGDAPIPTAVTVGEAELAAYREAHTPPPRGSAAPKPRPPAGPAPVQRPDPKPPVAASARPGAPPTSDEGRRVGDAVYGRRITSGSDGGHTIAQGTGPGRSSTPSSRRSRATGEISDIRGKNRPRDKPHHSR